MSERVIRQQYDRMAQRYDQRWISKTLSFLTAWAAIPPQAVVLLGHGFLEVEEMRRAK